jgi:hypothetical protein
MNASRRGTTVAVMAAVTVLMTGMAGCAGKADPVAAPGGSGPAAPSVVPASPSSSGALPSSLPSSPPAGAAAIPAAVPAAAFLRASDAGNGGTPELLDDPAVPPSFCGAAFASSSGIGIRRSSQLLWRHRDDPEGSTPAGTLTETVTVYRGDGATRFLTEVRKAVAGCRSQKVGSITHMYKALGAAASGRDSVLIEDSTPAFAEDGTPVSGRRFVYWAAVRAGDSVALVRNEGWEDASADRTEAAFFARKAGDRLAAWRS